MLVVEPDFQLYDTTLRDGMQQEGMALSVADKLTVASQLDGLGVGFIEGGWPGAIPKDTEFFNRARTELKLRHAELAAFGATRRPDLRVEHDPQVAALLEAQTPVVTLVAKSDVRHVERALRTTPAENLAMVRDTVVHLVREGRRVFVDAEHFFDGYHVDSGYTLALVQTAIDAGAEVVVLCDTNGGALPDQIADIVATVGGTGARLGIHCHDDTGCAVANTLFAVAAGAVHAQVTAHGYGERCGNANLFSVVPNLALKHQPPLVAADSLVDLTAVAANISGITTAAEHDREPYVGRAAFTHKAGLHASAVRVDPRLYEHISPEVVGNSNRTLVSDQAGRASIELKARELGYEVSAGTEPVARLAERVKTLEGTGYTFESADASFELLLREELGVDDGHTPFDLELWRITMHPEPGGEARYEACIALHSGDRSAMVTGHGASPADAMEHAVRVILARENPELPTWQLRRCACSDIDAGEGTVSASRVVLTFTDSSTGDGQSWNTIGVAADRSAACWLALRDAARYLVLRSSQGGPSESASSLIRVA